MMTRLTDDNIKELPEQLGGISKMLTGTTGMNLKTLACEAVGLNPAWVDMADYRVAVVPISSGLGIIRRFSESVADTVSELGMDAFVTDGTDVTGFAEGLTADADIIMMADDIQFIAYNTRARKYANNSFCTAAGYVTALKGAAKGLKGKDVLVIGAGRVGTHAVRLLFNMGANVTVTDLDIERARSLSQKYSGTRAVEDLLSAVASADLILNASPAAIPGSAIREGAIISTPGIPHVFDEEGRRRATIIHDPLAIGTSVMAVQSASFSLKPKKEDLYD
jgi:3-methylornithyl-N6-L-lysine dehydrogenase